MQLNEVEAFEDANIQTTCEVQGVSDTPEGGWEIALGNCAGDTTTYTLGLDHLPATNPFVNPGQMVELRWVQRAAFGPAEIWFTLRGVESSFLWLAGFDATELPGADPLSPIYLDVSPLELSVVEAGCAADASDGCGDKFRRALEVSWDAEVETVLDHGRGFIGPQVSYEIIVGDFTETPEVVCEDYPQRVYQAAFSWIPEG